MGKTVARSLTDPARLKVIARCWIVVAPVIYLCDLLQQTRLDLTDGVRRPFGDDFINYWSGAWLALPAIATLALAAQDGGSQTGDWMPWAVVAVLAAPMPWTNVTRSCEGHTVKAASALTGSSKATSRPALIASTTDG